MAARGTLNHDLSKLFNQLWDADVNRMKPGKHYRISLQGKAGYVLSGSSVARDSATFPLFQFVDEEELKRRKTFQAFMSLLDNYEMSTGVAEVVTATEIAENNRFLDAILETKVMQITHEYLIQKKIVKPSLKDFKSQLYGIWFQLYSREPGRGHDSCGFEHVFVGESKRGKEITGLHNWVQFYLQEKHQNIDYKGYVARQHKNRVSLRAAVPGMLPRISYSSLTKRPVWFCSGPAARRGRSGAEPPVQLEGHGEAGGGQLHRRQSGVRVRRVHGHLPHVAGENHQRDGGGRRDFVFLWFPFLPAVPHPATRGGKSAV
uniref:Protein endoU n=1 Tax=Leptobrachium leishanense TaxID=445787 RepID=A0A8C5MA46_9ANUR